jgi:hypothetical protein
MQSVLAHGIMLMQASIPYLMQFGIASTQAGGAVGDTAVI